ncbi:hypothetical protein GGR88_001226 [Sphingomonas jejuensis]|uniref:Uncharacterized protein n=1 Tax=Sphingomonas jejuensis TaxID=904715 RepID=A0ABX0XLV4_9SPHN|nr:hypothetical protein [Sphingomonas jejuensis]NJC33752.1 hypothetical protein [Sphingomonas jejuensis]
MALLLIATSGDAIAAAPPPTLGFEEGMSAEEIGQTIAAIEAHPDQADPFQWAIVAAREFERGNRLRATFWFYMFQIRSRPWARADGAGSGAAALRASLNATLGPTVNAWIAADPAIWQDVATRAIAFEARLPLHPDRPEGMDEAAWRRLVAEQRAAYAAEARSAFADLEPAEVARARRENGLPSGSLTDQGRPLDESWR